MPHSRIRSIAVLLRTHWLAAVCLILAALTVVETLGFARTGILTGDMPVVLCLAGAALTLLLPLSPSLLAWPLLGLEFFLDISAITMPNAMFLTTMLVIVMMAYRSPALGVLAASFPFASSVYITVRENGYPIWMFSSILQYACWYYSMAFVGYWARRHAELLALRQREHQRSIREHIQRRLHDSAANSLTYLVTLAEQQTETGDPRRDRAVLSEIRDVARDALDETRRAIDLLEADIGRKEAPRDSDADADGPGGSIARIALRGDRQLHTLGFRGTSIIDVSDSSGMPEDVAALLTAFIRELYGNILKYAEPTAYYAVAIRTTPDRIVVTASDTPRREPLDDGNSSRSGLRRHIDAIVHVGGTVDTDRTDDMWRIAVHIPLQPAPANPR